MDLPDDVSAFDECVVRNGLGDDEVAWLRRQRECRATTVSTAAADKLVNHHHVPFLRGRWSAYEEWLPRTTAVEGRISRGDVFGVADACRQAGDWLPLLVTSFVWGQGNNARGPARLGWIFEGRPGRAAPPAEEIERRLCAAVGVLNTKGAVSAYQVLSDTGRIPQLGPAFFTKFLYFTGNAGDLACPPVILDARLAERMRWLWQRRYDWPCAAGVREPDWLWRGPRWSAYRYHVYLAFLNKAAGQLSNSGERWTPDLVELLLFRQDPGEDLLPALPPI